MNQSYSRIVATGRAVPEQTIDNSEIEMRCHLEPGWILQRTGIRTRPVVRDDQAVSDLAIEAGQQALDRFTNRFSDSNQRPEIARLILATSTPDHLLPPTAPLVAHRLGLGNIAAFDMAVACSGFLYALQLADQVCRTDGRAALVIAANVLSKRVDPGDPSTAAIFADGAGAVVVAPDKQPGLMAIELESDGSGYSCLMIPDGGSRSPFHEKTLESGGHRMRIENGMAVFKYAVESMSRLGQEVLDQSGLTAAEVDFWIPHQANLRIIDSVRQRLNLPPEKTGITIDRFANSSAATIPLALDYFLEQNIIQRGQNLLFTVAAAGLTAGAAVLRL